MSIRKENESYEDYKKRLKEENKRRKEAKRGTVYATMADYNAAHPKKKLIAMPSVKSAHVVYRVFWGPIPEVTENEDLPIEAFA